MIWLTVKCVLVRWPKVRRYYKYYKSRQSRPGTRTKRLKVKYDVLLSNFALNFNLRRYVLAAAAGMHHFIEVGRCRLTLSNPR